MGGTWGQTGRTPIIFSRSGNHEANPSHRGGRGQGHPCCFLPMTRLPQVVIVDVRHHVTQRGNARQGILASYTDCVGC